MTYKLRDYQVEMSDIMVRAFTGRSSHNTIIQAAQGAGKSLVIADVASKIGQVLVLCPSKELLLQNHDKMLAYDIPDVKLYSASVNQKDIGAITLATVGSCYRTPEKFAGFKHVIVDECDTVGPKDAGNMYRKLFAGMGGPQVVGLTATPFRNQMKMVTYNHELYFTSVLKVLNRIWDRTAKGTFWGNITYRIETQELIDMGYLVPVDYHSDDIELNELRVNTTGADFTTVSLEAWAKTRVGRVVQIAKTIDGTCHRHLIFVASVASGERLHGLLAIAGLRATLVTAETPTSVRDAAVAAFRTGELKHLINVGVYIAGLDVPEIDAITFARPTMSVRVWAQAVGRGLRLDPARPDKRLQVYDLAGVRARLGAVENLRVRPETGGFREEVWGEFGRLDEQALFTFKVKRGAQVR